MMKPKRTLHFKRRKIEGRNGSKEPKKYHYLRSRLSPPKTEINEKISLRFEANIETTTTVNFLTLKWQL